LGVEQHDADGHSAGQRCGVVANVAADQIEATLLGDRAARLELGSGHDVAGHVTAVHGPGEEAVRAEAVVGRVGGRPAVDVGLGEPVQR
jgi:hypothetical protein